MNFKGFDDWIPIFRGGKQIDSEGIEHDGDQLIDQAIATFDPSYHEPPVVIGHPKDNAPAYGWIAGLKKAGNVLMAKFKDLVPEFIKAVQDGLYKKRSASFYPDGRLRHVGFLGAVPPAVKALADLKFDETDHAITFDFYDPGMGTIARIFRNLRDWLIEKEGKEKADQLIGDWDIEYIKDKADEVTEVAVSHPAFADSADKDAQKARAKKYKIAIKKGGNVTKPSEWKNVPADQFLDPVNFRYPCPDAAQTRAAASYWGMPKNQAQYSPSERAIINARLNKFRKKFKIGSYRKEDTNMSGFKEKIKNFLSFLGVDMDQVPDDALPLEPPKGASGIFTEADIEAAKNEAAAEARKNAEDEFAENAKNAAKEARKQEISGWCEGLLSEGKITPSLIKFGVPEILNFLADSDDVIEFGESKEKATMYDRFKALFETELPRLVNFKEIANRGNDMAGNGSAADKLNALVKKKMADNKDLTYGAAFTEVQREYPDLVAEYQTEIGIQ